jgi:hypothetical protein
MLLMRVERDDYREFHVRGSSDDGEQGWGIQVWLKGSHQDGPEDHQYRVVNGHFNQSPDEAEKEAILTLIEKWEERLPVMVASPINPR